jgi:putative zinc finger/helix-turn-helix YgiT family protein
MTKILQVCDFCGADSLVTSYQNEHFLYGSSEDIASLTARVPVRSCLECGQSFTDEEAEAYRHEAVCTHLGRLTPSNIRAIRESNGLTQEQFAEISGFGVASIKRWECANQIQNLSADRYLRLLRIPQNFQFVRMIGSNHEHREASFRTTLSDRSIQDSKLFRLRPSKIVEFVT